MTKLLCFVLLFVTSISEAEMTQLKECPESPNCVSTQAQQADKKMDPIPFTDSKQQVIERIKTAVSSEKRTELIKQEDDYLHFTFKSRLFGFVDDVEFLIDEDNQLIHFRSASRTGYSDLGVNRKRMEGLSKKLLK